MSNTSEKVLTHAKSIANAFAQHFSLLKAPPTPCHKTSLTPLSTTFKFTEVIEQDVLKRLTSLNERKAAGPDGISAKLLRMVAPTITSDLFNASLKQGCSPSAWKQANVTPVPKPGDKHSVQLQTNISHSVLSKVLESIVHHQLYSYLDDHGILKEEQAGFRPNRSTQDILLRTIDDWKIALDNKKPVATVMIDLSKAYDTINPHKLQLDAYSIRET